jgi:hypothetical protein
MKMTANMKRGLRLFLVVASNLAHSHPSPSSPRPCGEKGARRVRFIALGAGEGCIDVEEMDAAGEHNRYQHQCTPRPFRSSHTY